MARKSKIDAVLDALRAAFAGFRVSHDSVSVKRCVRGVYLASDRAAEVTGSLSFTRPSRVFAWFSIDDLNLDQKADAHALRSVALRIGEDECQSDILFENVPIYLARTVDQLRTFVEARVPGPDGLPDPERIKAFSERNPETCYRSDYLWARARRSSSLAKTTYWGVHSFPVTDSLGETRFIKLKITPVGPESSFRNQNIEEPASLLLEEFESHIKKRGVRFSLLALLGGPGDNTTDVTDRWQNEDQRDAVRLGTIVITGIEPGMACKTSMSGPARLAEGIGYPLDGLFQARWVAYKFWHGLDIEA
ncbi:catalase [Bradyrhizobium tropiciagri]|uniref:catalase n=1 Tax=Bradyrhizobium tropiciagri TaxID=312253 RepID=UPI001BA4EF10|nr:catalase [Bradyrhizobium tropiciagri]MBR0873318.1 catalase [Bradyrhizobium tropiciagri]